MPNVCPQARSVVIDNVCPSTHTPAYIKDCILTDRYLASHGSLTAVSALSFEVARCLEGYETSDVTLRAAASVVWLS